MTNRAHITVTRPSGVTQSASGAFTGGSVSTILTGWGDFQPMDERKAVELDGTRIEGVNGRVFFDVPTQVAALRVDDDITILDEYAVTHTGTVAGFRAFDGTILVRA